MSPKKYHRSHTRKYVGVIFSIGEFNYYAPLSSPKTADYNEDGSIKGNNLFTIRLIEGSGDNKKLLGTIKLNYMIPVSMKYVEGYSIEKETDKKYKAVVLAELKSINKNQSLIVKKAILLYNFKKHESKNIDTKNKVQYSNVLPFTEIEEYIKTKKLL